MGIDDQLRQAGNRLNAELEQLPVPKAPQSRNENLRIFAIAAVVTVVVGAGALWLTRGGDGRPVAPVVPTSTSSTTSTTSGAVEPADEPQPAGPVAVVAEGTFEGSDESWRFTAFVSESGTVCMRLRGMTCGPIPSASIPVSAPSSTTDHLAELSCAYGALHSDVAEVVLTFSDGSVRESPIYGGGDLPADFYAYCWAGDALPVSVTALDTNGNSLAESGLSDGTTKLDQTHPAIRLLAGGAADYETFSAAASAQGLKSFTCAASGGPPSWKLCLIADNGVLAVVPFNMVEGLTARVSDANLTHDVVVRIDTNTPVGVFDTGPQATVTIEYLGESVGEMSAPWAPADDETG